MEVQVVLNHALMSQRGTVEYFKGKEGRMDNLAGRLRRSRFKNVKTQKGPL